MRVALTTSQNKNKEHYKSFKHQDRHYEESLGKAFPTAAFTVGHLGALDQVLRLAQACQSLPLNPCTVKAILVPHANLLR